MIEIDIAKELDGSEGKFTLRAAFTLAAGEFTSLFGPSGAGKSSILRMIAGLMEPDEGSIRVDGVPWYDSAAGIHLPPQKRRVGLVFQEYNLFPHMTLRENLLFALDKGADRQVVEDFLFFAGLKGLADAMPRTLSGGQKQRAALLRALVRKPSVLLLDEPFAALDMRTRAVMQQELLKIQKEMGVATLFVSHDIADVLHLSTSIMLLEEGKVAPSSREELEGYRNLR